MGENFPLLVASPAQRRSCSLLARGPFRFGGEPAHLIHFDRYRVTLRRVWLPSPEADSEPHPVTGDPTCLPDGTR
jgi:hypothetical protein